MYCIYVDNRRESPALLICRNIPHYTDNSFIYSCTAQHLLWSHRVAHTHTHTQTRISPTTNGCPWIWTVNFHQWPYKLFHQYPIRNPINIIYAHNIRIMYTNSHLYTCIYLCFIECNWSRGLFIRIRIYIRQ